MVMTWINSWCVATKFGITLRIYKIYLCKCLLKIVQVRTIIINLASPNCSLENYLLSKNVASSYNQQCKYILMLVCNCGTFLTLLHFCNFSKKLFVPYTDLSLQMTSLIIAFFLLNDLFFRGVICNWIFSTAIYFWCPISSVKKHLMRLVEVNRNHD